MKNNSLNKDFTIVYLDQFASSGIFESTTKEWIKIKELIIRGFKNKKIICPLSSEHYIETSQKQNDKAVYLDSEFFKISGGYAFKSELFITCQLLISLIRKNNITLQTYLYDKIHENVLSKEDNYKQFDENKKQLNSKIEEATLVANEIRKIERNKKSDAIVRQKMFEAHKSISVSEFISRLNALLQEGHIYIRGVSFASGDVPNWIDQIIFQLTNKHRITPKETRLLIKELKLNGFKNIPTLDIRTSISALISVQNKKEIVNDQVDIMRVSSGLPISDILLTDATRKREIEELELDKKYNTMVFSGKNEDLENLINELEKRNN